MLNKAALLLIILGVLCPVSVQAQQLVDICEQTIRYAGMFVYGDEGQEIGLKFAWKNDNNQWKPVGNGFVFLSEGLKIRDFMTPEGLEAEDVASRWYVKKEFLAENNDDDELDSAMFAVQDLVSWVNPDGECLDDIFMNIKLTDKTPTSPLPSGFIQPSISFTGVDNDDIGSEVEFVAVNDTVNGDLILRFTNLLPQRLQVEIDNRPFPASPVGWRSQSVASSGDESVETTVAAINMDGHLVVPPYSFSIYVFPTKKQKSLIPKDL